MCTKADVREALPFKLIFFVLADGWSLVAGSLVQSYGG
jgi:flagellar biosynthesis protein FliP